MNNIKASLGLLLAAVLAGAFAVTSSAGNTGSPRSGELHVTKECSQYTGDAGDYCTIVSSNLDAIKVGSRVYYLEPLNGDLFDGDVVLYAGHGNAAFGHCKVNYSTAIGRCTLRGGVGQFKGFHADVAVSPDPTNDVGARWDGAYTFAPRGHNK